MMSTPYQCVFCIQCMKQKVDIICLGRFDSSLELRKKFLYTDGRVCTTPCRRKLRFGSYRLDNTPSSAWRLNKNSRTYKIKAWSEVQLGEVQ